MKIDRDGNYYLIFKSGRSLLVHGTLRVQDNGILSSFEIEGAHITHDEIAAVIPMLKVMKQ